MVCRGENGAEVIMNVILIALIVLWVILMLYAVQLYFLFLDFMTNELTTKKELWTGLIPFYKVVKAIIQEVTFNYKKLK